MTALLFLDIDGVLNNHETMENGYCGTDRQMVKRLNYVLDLLPEVQIVVSSAWRYACLNGICTLAGLEHLLLTHGVKCHERIHGVTGADPEKFDPAHHSVPFDVEYWKVRGLRWRAEQIDNYVDCVKPDAWVAVDDLPLTLHPAHFCKTDGSVGLTDECAYWIEECLAEQIAMSKAKRKLNA